MTTPSPVASWSAWSGRASRPPDVFLPTIIGPPGNGTYPTLWQRAYARHLRDLLRQPQREDHREAWGLDRSLIVGRLKSRPIEKSCASIDLRCTEICHAHLGMKRRIRVRGRPSVSVGHRR
jgi:hypothetical protein